MLLTARLLDHVTDVNTFVTTTTLQFTEGDTPTVYLQLIDTAIDRAFNPPGRRFCPASGSTLSITVYSLDKSKAFTRSATQPFASSDTSIWQLPILSTDSIRGTMNLKLQLSQGGVVTTGWIEAALVINPANPATILPQNTFS